ncbi:NADP-dependent phosphogluconate dehydrogenase [Sulfitobacter sp. HNIBRBA3233]|uniref:NADP-dependent phosphogluconate dehydrogenase n=1 Tax=Sulfitobacter marinivivus TaxID=3158558 RepID=UPI0032E02E0B
MSISKADIGVYGLGTMGSALALNLAENGFRVAVSNREEDWIAPFVQEAGDLSARLVACGSLEELVAAVTPPRNILFMIPSGAPMDAMLDAVLPMLDPGDTVIDGGNADFNDTRRRSDTVAAAGMHFVGMGVSGGETGARHGPSMMVGGSEASWHSLRPILESIAARFDGDPCVAHVGPDGAGHFVKTVHNGIEYADMQMIAEIYGLLRDAAGWDAGRIGGLFQGWNDTELGSFLIEVSAAALQTRDPQTGGPLVDAIVDRAGQKGTGRWTVIEALKMGQSASAIEAAVGARSWSSDSDLRDTASGILSDGALNGEVPDEEALADALLAGRILAHAQGFDILRAGSATFDWGLDPARIAEIWRAGCIIRSALLERFASASRTDPPHGALILAPDLADTLARCLPGLRRVVRSGVALGIPLPALSAALAWYDSLRTARGTTNLIQAQRDFFGAHGFGRRGQEGQFTFDWPPLGQG